ncbi:MAG: S8 family serine peptidase [Pseudomonadota bacterium]
MKSIRQFIKGISFSSYFKRVDPAVAALLSLERVKTIPVVMTFRRPMDAHLESKLKRAGFKVKYHLPFINGITGKIQAGSFDSVSSIVEITKIYFDRTACLMGSSERNEKTLETGAAAPALLSGRGVSVAFIDSGVYPHPDLVKPRNRLLAFKDYINGIEYPYDDSGHGTACIGAAFGASVDGKFRGTAYDSGIICAKAFNSLGYGFSSDILAAMQWILNLKESHNIHVAVLPFGSPPAARGFDLLSLASEYLCKNGLFVSACSGNLGPNEGSITSPGSCASIFTTGALSISGNASVIAGFSGRGPINGTAEKPDAVMPGVRVTTLNSDTGYVPGNKSLLNAKLQGQQYTEITGTSVAASHTAAAAALLYQKKPNISPEDAKSILKKLCTSVNELKTAQGAGIIDMKRIEEL